MNRRESSAFHGATVRQSGFQETKIVELVRPITKYAVGVKNPEDLRRELAKGYAIARAGRMGPVLIDVPMDIQQMEVGDEVLMPAELSASTPASGDTLAAIDATFAKSRRPVVLWGAGIGLAGVEREVMAWLAATGIPFVASWAGLGSFDHDAPNFLGQIGVYGNRGANFVLQNADAVIVLGSRLDNRQRSGNAKNFAVGATVHSIDIDEEELKKYGADGYTTSCLDLRYLPGVLTRLRTAGHG